MIATSETDSPLQACVCALMQELDHAQRAAVRLDFQTVEKCALQHMRLSENLRQALISHPQAEELIAPLRASLRRYSLVLQASTRLVETIARVMESGRVVPAYEV